MSADALRALAWSHEFDQFADSPGSRADLRARARKVALHRATGRMPSQIPSGSKLSTSPGAAMPPIPFTRHAAHRLKNRGISLDQVHLVTDFGRPQRVHGATRYALDKESREFLKQTFPPDELRRFKSLDIVAVVSDDGTLITAAHRTERLRHKISHH